MFLRVPSAPLAIQLIYFDPPGFTVLPVTISAFTGATLQAPLSFVSNQFLVLLLDIYEVCLIVDELSADVA